MRKRSKQVLLGLVLVSIAAASVTLSVKHSAQKRRQAQYDAQLARYQAAVKLGTSRAALDTLLRSRQVAFEQLWSTPFGQGNDYADLVKIGSENPLWYCGSKNVYIAFEFAGQGADWPRAHPSDRLQSIVLFPHLDNCM